MVAKLTPSPCLNVTGGLPGEKVGRVVGLASSVLLDSQSPDSPLNRRISIIVMYKRTEDAITQENGALFSVQDPAQGGQPVPQGPSEGIPVAEAQPVASVTAP